MTETIGKHKLRPELSLTTRGPLTDSVCAAFSVKEIWKSSRFPRKFFLIGMDSHYSLRNRLLRGRTTEDLPQASAFLDSLGAIQLEIDLNRPVEPAFAWTGGGGHVVIVRGYYDDGKVHVNDPWYGQGAITYADLVTAYGLGTWFWTFSDLRR